MTRRRTFALVPTLLFLASLPAAAQIPDKFENLKILPKETTKAELVPLMRSFSGALGVRCNHCHVGPDNLRDMNFATDEKPEKVAAREMMKMVAKINNDFLANVKTSRATRVTVECATCHHGVAVPQRIESILLDTAKSDGVAAAKSRWLELEEKYSGRAAYDFGFPPLVQVAEDLESAEKVADAALMADFAVERFPTEAWPRLAAADLHAKLGEKEAAIAGVRKVLEMDPGNGMAKRMLEKLQAPTE